MLLKVEEAVMLVDNLPQGFKVTCRGVIAFLRIHAREEEPRAKN
jgi:hypothetical protein